ncbi:MAG: hypothetical protein O3C20_14650 [Verrucomicrobia bacterium]|nr:hypothetical protein [Verrucomicrobiota bacterium]
MVQVAMVVTPWTGEITVRHPIIGVTTNATFGVGLLKPGPLETFLWRDMMTPALYRHRIENQFRQNL